ncbi:MAG: hypothetical protein RR523_13995 [Cetobacterium sp.]|uniref:hypothetical protein n=1 Tax=Cetobacterium sp. TaxID=2071632 RepID=UPI002FC6C3D5
MKIKKIILFLFLTILAGCSSFKAAIEDPDTIFNGPKDGAIVQEFTNTSKTGRGNESTMF